MCDKILVKYHFYPISARVLSIRNAKFQEPSSAKLLPLISLNDSVINGRAGNHQIQNGKPWRADNNVQSILSARQRGTAGSVYLNAVLLHL